MFLTKNVIEESSYVKEIVSNDFRTARVLSKYGIEYCCGGNWPLDLVCASKGLDTSSILDELNRESRTITLSNSTPFSEWKIDFLIDYIINVHHSYLRKAVPAVSKGLAEFTAEHATEFPNLPAVTLGFQRLANELLPHLEEEEKIIFPYARQVAHAYLDKDSIGALLVRTLRKPLENFIKHEQAITESQVGKMRNLTNNYQPPANACIQHKVMFSMLREIDDDLSQHVYLENEILFPRIIAMENHLLQ